MLILPKLEAPKPPLLNGQNDYDIIVISNYLQTLVDYFYNCNAPLADDVLGESQGSAKYNESSFTFGITGFTTTPSLTASYVQVGRQVTINFPSVSLTSNATTFTITGIPAAITPSPGAAYMVPTFDNGASVNGMIFLTSSTWGLYTNSGGSGWTAVGTKGFQPFSVTYTSV